MSTLLDKSYHLPAEAIKSKDIFGCLVNDQAFMPSPVPGHAKAVYGELQYYNKITGINIYADDHISNRAIIIFLYNPMNLQIGETYSLSDPEFFVQFIDFAKPPACTYLAAVKGSITIDVCDLLSKSPRVAGTFEFSACSDDCAEIVIISEGSFDIRDIKE